MIFLLMWMTLLQESLQANWITEFQKFIDSQKEKKNDSMKQNMLFFDTLYCIIYS